MLAGVSIACKDLAVGIIGSEPEIGPSEVTSDIESGVLPETRTSVTIADGLRSSISLRNWELIRQRECVHSVYAVTDLQIKMAMKWLI